MVSLNEESELALESQPKIFALDVPVYRQRYLAVVDYVNRTHARRVLDIGCAECSLLRSLIQCPSVEELCGVDLDAELVRRNRAAVEPLPFHYIHRRTNPLSISGLCGSIAEPGRRFVDFDLISMVEIIEHLHDETLARMPQAVFGRLRPRAAIVTTPNADFNVLFPDMGTVDAERKFRHWDHKFEWSRTEFETWACGIANDYGYRVEFSGVGPGIVGTEHLGCCSQMALFERIQEVVEQGKVVPASASGVLCEFVDYEELWEVEWPHCPRLLQIDDELQALGQLLTRRAYDLYESLDFDEEVHDAVAQQVVPVPETCSASQPCDCGYEMVVTSGDQSDNLFGCSEGNTHSTLPSSRQRCVPHVCLKRIIAWNIPLSCLLARCRLERLQCTEEDIRELVRNSEQEATSSQPAGTVSLKLSENGTSLVWPWLPPSDRYGDTSEYEDDGETGGSTADSADTNLSCEEMRVAAGATELCKDGSCDTDRSACDTVDPNAGGIRSQSWQNPGWEEEESE